MQEVGAEWGVTTGRRRRCGWLDLVVLKFSNLINGYDSLNLTKLDVLDGFEEIQIGVGYEVDGKELDAFPGALRRRRRAAAASSSSPSSFLPPSCHLDQPFLHASTRTSTDPPPHPSLFARSPLTRFSFFFLWAVFHLFFLSFRSGPADLELLAKVQVKYATLPGWQTDITSIGSYAELPANCRAYVEFIERFVGVPVEWIGNGPARESMIVKPAAAAGAGQQ